MEIQVRHTNIHKHAISIPGYNYAPSRLPNRFHFWHLDTARRPRKTGNLLPFFSFLAFSKRRGRNSQEETIVGRRRRRSRGKGRKKCQEQRHHMETVPLLLRTQVLRQDTAKSGLQLLLITVLFPPPPPTRTWKKEKKKLLQVRSHFQSWGRGFADTDFVDKLGEENDGYRKKMPFFTDSSKKVKNPVQSKNSLKTDAPGKLPFPDQLCPGKRNASEIGRIKAMD